MVGFWTCLKGKPIGFVDTEHGCERRAQGIWLHHQEGAAWNLERGEERRERGEEEGKESSLEESEVFLLTRGGLAGWRKETEWVSSPTGGTYTVCQVKAGNGLDEEKGLGLVREDEEGVVYRNPGANVPCTVFHLGHLKWLGYRIFGIQH